MLIWCVTTLLRKTFSSPLCPHVYTQRKLDNQHILDIRILEKTWKQIISAHIKITSQGMHHSKEMKPRCCACITFTVLVLTILPPLPFSSFMALRTSFDWQMLLYTSRCGQSTWTRVGHMIHTNAYLRMHVFVIWLRYTHKYTHTHTHTHLFIYAAAKLPRRFSKRTPRFLRNVHSHAYYVSLLICTCPPPTHRPKSIP
jgi:hypothetical protein